MDLVGLYNNMGGYSLYDLRDEFLDWIHNHETYNLRTEITDEVLAKIPDKYITETRKAQLKTELLIEKEMHPKAYKKAIEEVNNEI